MPPRRVSRERSEAPRARSTCGATLCALSGGFYWRGRAVIICQQEQAGAFGEAGKFRPWAGPACVFTLIHRGTLTWFLGPVKPVPELAGYPVPFLRRGTVRLRRLHGLIHE